MLESISLWLAICYSWPGNIDDLGSSSHGLSLITTIHTVNLYCHGVLKNETTVEYNRVDGQTVVE